MKNIIKKMIYVLDFNNMIHVDVFVSIMDFANKSTYELARTWTNIYIMTTTHCGRCISEAGQELRVICPYIRGAIIWEATTRGIK